MTEFCADFENSITTCPLANSNYRMSFTVRNILISELLKYKKIQLRINEI